MTWNDFIVTEQQKDYYKSLTKSMKEEYANNKCYPPKELIFNALNQCPFEKVKCVIIGQDPYHGPGQAMGMSFSVPRNCKIPPSLQNIYKELSNEYRNFKIPDHGDLTTWANQGVLLLNTTLTVREHQPMSHTNLGWEIFTTNVIKELNGNPNPIVYMLWGRHAQSLKQHILNVQEHLILESPHPSPFSANRGFFGNGHFHLCNDYLVSHGESPINWQV